MVPWLECAFLEMNEGVEEIPGKAHHPQIIAYHAETSLKASTDEIPWCSAFACAMMEWSGIPSTRSAAARSWLEWGLPLIKPVEGCVVVLWRGNKTGPSGHVGFFVGETETSVLLLGGNQDNEVNIQEYLRGRVLSYRWPNPEHFAGVPGADKDVLDS